MRFTIPSPRTTCTLLLALAFALVEATPSMAKGETWRHSEAFQPAEGPASITLRSEDVARQVKKLSRRQRRKGTDAPPMKFLVRNDQGVGVSGVGVRVVVRFGPKSRNNIVLTGATDRDGRFEIRPEAVSAVSHVAAEFSWDGGTKITRIEFKPSKRGDWDPQSAPYRNSASGSKEGSCRNLFDLKNRRKQIDLEFNMPASLLACESVAGTEGDKGRSMRQLAQIGNRDINRGDKNDFSEEDERKMGVQAAEHFDKQFEGITDRAIVGYIEDLVSDVVAASDAPGMPINVRVIHGEAVNAFATAGGNVYVFTGLIAAAQNEAQLAGVLAHEVSHVTARHVTEGATKQTRTQLAALVVGLGAGALLGLEDDEREKVLMGSLATAGLYGMKHGRAAETEADFLGSQYLWKAGWDPESIANFFEVLESKGPDGAPPAWLSTHPSHERRIENGRHWARSFLPSQERYLVDTPRFRQVQGLVAKLPPPKKKPEQADAEVQGLAPLMVQTPAYKEVQMRRGLAVLQGKE